LHKAVVDGERNAIATMIAAAIQDSVQAHEILNGALIAAMNRVAEMWQREEYFLPEVLRSAKTMQAAMEALKPHMVITDHLKPTKVVMGTVKGDRHDIGKNLVSIMLQGVGYPVEDLGVDVPAERFLEAARGGAHVLGLSSLLTTSMPEMRNVIVLLEGSGLRGKVTVMVGGAPVTPEYAAKIGADHYAKDAAGAIEVLNRIFG
jgi:5-methyltetrahydrofolate--homocysteine methyltransferase